jgi:cytochrome c oxidase subunit 3
MKFTINNQKHGFHLVDPSPWPLITAFSALMLTFGGVLYMHGYIGGSNLLKLGLCMILFVMFVWWRDVIREGTFEGQHTFIVQKGLLFIIFVYFSIITKLQYKLLSFFFCFSDASEPWQLGLQDPATSVVEGMIFFHDYLMFFFIVIGFFLVWISYIILKNFDENTNFSIINFTHYSPLEFMGTANRVDVILLTSIFLFSTLFYCLTMIVKINFLIFKLRIQKFHVSRQRILFQLMKSLI